MTVDLSTASAFLTAHARLLDRQRYRRLTGAAGPEPVLAALEAYRNPDGGYGWGLEPDLRSPESQTGAALHAFEVFAEIGPHTTERAGQLCDWLDSVTLPGGGLPFALPVTDATGCAPFWSGADPAEPSLQISAIVAENAHRVAAHDPAVAAHPWLATVTDYCLSAIGGLEQRPHALVLAFAVRLLNVLAGTRPEALPLLDRLAAFVPRDGRLHVEGGAEDELMRPLDFAPLPGQPARNLLDPVAVEADLHRLAEGQQADGGWRADFHSYSAAAALEWRGYTTVGALSVLRGNGFLG
ncbi:hypothetical protein [Sciscionella sediminilitoris]|uniref:hypothetical protein n=1 Tax=Sciscionella sediminilitoris TaxID=1445613 RepID=UPI0004DFBBEF|nr:hypothetical protein [Sciscionella sp. SE31]